MRAPNTPRDTRTPMDASISQNPLVERLCEIGRGRVREARSIPSPGVCDERDY
jgi:hypothetical protein